MNDTGTKTAMIADPRRPIVDIAKCDNCHKQLALHGNNRVDNVELCAACHNPHQSSLEGLLLAKDTDLCLGCHATLKAAMGAGRVHSPAARDCRRCHQPHSSGEDRLMVKPVRTLCAECHNLGTAAFSGAHLEIDPARIRCERCHDPHASKEPGFFKSNVHAPFAMKSCQIGPAAAEPVRPIVTASSRPTRPRARATGSSETRTPRVARRRWPTRCGGSRSA